jgi:hypothetical protein
MHGASSSEPNQTKPNKSKPPKIKLRKAKTNKQEYCGLPCQREGNSLEALEMIRNLHHNITLALK